MARPDALVCPPGFSWNREFKSPRTRTDGPILRKTRGPSDLAAVTALRAGRDDPGVQHPQDVWILLVQLPAEARGRSKWLRSAPRRAGCHMYWPVAALSVFDTRTATTLARLMITPL